MNASIRLSVDLTASLKPMVNLMYIGIDLGTSGIKTILMSQAGEIVASASRGLKVDRPKLLWSEQNPADWWVALQQTLDELAEHNSLADVRSIGITGQMHGATLLDKDNNIIRPCILWNDGRSAAECVELEQLVADSRQITGNIMMPGFTAPKLLWIKKHEPQNFSKISKVLLPKDYLRFLLSGDYASDMSDAAGMLWLDVAKRDWNDALLAATGLSRLHMPELYEGNQITGVLLPELARRWGMGSVPIVAGGGDNAAGAVGVGIIQPGQAMLSLGTSGVYFVVSDGMVANPEAALHSYCHALPKTWHAMSVMLSAASCLDWLADLCGYADVGTMLAELEKSNIRDTDIIFLPYLSGERTPHNNPDAKGMFFGMTMAMNKLELVLAVLEGVALAFADGADAVHSTGLIPNEISLIGGGARNAFWRQIICDVLGKSVTYRVGGDVGPALGAARLARLAIETELPISDVCPVPAEVQRHSPDAQKHALYSQKREKFQALYRQTNELM